MLDQAFGDGISSARMRNSLVLFPVDSEFFPTFVSFRSVRHQSCCHCDSCNWYSVGVAVWLCLRGGKSTIVVSVNE